MNKCHFPDGVTVNIGGADIDPCQYKLVEIHRNVTVEILRCPICGDVSIGWHAQEDTEDIFIDGLETDDHDVSGLTEEE